MALQISFCILILAVVFALSNGCALDGKCRGGCRRSFSGKVDQVSSLKPCDLECSRRATCVDKCVKPKVCTAKYECTRRCAWKYDKEQDRTFIRCWCVSFGTCGKCDCKKPRVFPWQRIRYAPF